MFSFKAFLYFPEVTKIFLFQFLLRGRSCSNLVLLLLLSLESQGFVVLHEEVGVLLVGRLLEHRLLPQVGGQEGVGLRDGGVSGLGWKNTIF